MAKTLSRFVFNRNSTEYFYAQELLTYTDDPLPNGEYVTVNDYLFDPEETGSALHTVTAPGDCIYDEYGCHVYKDGELVDANSHDFLYLVLSGSVEETTKHAEELYRRYLVEYCKYWFDSIISNFSLN